jgi:hypothetical protein
VCISSLQLLYSPDISRIVGEILRTPQWAPGNSLAILIERVAGSGVRWVESYAVNQLFAARTGSSGATPALEVHASWLPPAPPSVTYPD